MLELAVCSQCLLRLEFLIFYAKKASEILRGFFHL